MNRNVLLLLIVAVCANPKLIGQVTITSNHMPEVGDTIRYSTVNSMGLNLDLQTTGANSTWDYSGLEANGTALYSYESALKTPYIFNFFGAMGLKIADTLGFGQMSATKVYGFYKNSSSSYVQRGYGFSLTMPGTSTALPLSGEYTDEDEIYEFPLKFNDTYSNSFNLKIPIGTFPFVIGNFYRTGTRTTTVDGWGKISTPYKNNIDCIRVKSIYESKDSISVTTPPLNFGIPTRTIEYKWLSPTEKIPMLEIIGNEVGGIFTPTSVRYRGEKSVQNTSINELNSSATCFPNPVEDFLHYQSNNKLNHQIELLNSTGQIISHYEVVNGYAQLDFRSLPNGLYFIKNNHEITKIIH